MAKGDLSDIRLLLRKSVAAWEHLKAVGASKQSIAEARKDVLYWKRRVKALKGQKNA